MRDVVLGLGFVAVLEGLVLVLLPMRLEDVLRTLERIGREQRQVIGLALMAMGALFIWLAKDRL
ncbi:MAG: DUF2065 family protein [Paracoccaceae bacterium]|nr:DUF2065 family protein [Paracoccaceae bacterium]MDE2913930.1 DUF2065 family protein [Paracoccaceae bacterium]